MEEDPARPLAISGHEFEPLESPLPDAAGAVVTLSDLEPVEDDVEAPEPAGRT